MQNPCLSKLAPLNAAQSSGDFFGVEDRGLFFLSPKTSETGFFDIAEGDRAFSLSICCLGCLSSAVFVGVEERGFFLSPKTSLTTFLDVAVGVGGRAAFSFRISVMDFLLLLVTEERDLLSR
jgi:hypothetical protein